MPLVDMPLDELQSYQGTNPRPSDFDSFWDAGLAELDKLGTEVCLESAGPHIPGVECFDAWFTGVGGARIYAKHVRPVMRPAKSPAVIEFHGYSMQSGEWIDLAKWVHAGFSAWSLDVRGQGGRSEDVGGVRGTTLRGHIVRGLGDEPSKMLYRSIFLDCAQLARIAASQDDTDGSRIGTIGWSQGGGLSLACAALSPFVTRCVSAYPFLADYQRVWAMDLAKDAYDELRYFLRSFDPTHARIQEIWMQLGYIDVQHLAPRIKGEVRMLTGLMDTICPPSTQFAAYNKLTGPKSIVIYPNHSHEGLPGAVDANFEFLSKL
ncbi:MAG: acetylxylan esterase [Chthonomonas sp.]|nr:acetylxylan esterase [Chthonomonas sp.]